MEPAEYFLPSREEIVGHRPCCCSLCLYAYCARKVPPLRHCIVVWPSSSPAVRSPWWRLCAVSRKQSIVIGVWRRVTPVADATCSFTSCRLSSDVSGHFFSVDVEDARKAKNFRSVEVERIRLSDSTTSWHWGEEVGGGPARSWFSEEHIRVARGERGGCIYGRQRIEAW